MSAALGPLRTNHIIIHKFFYTSSKHKSVNQKSNAASKQMHPVETTLHQNKCIHWRQLYIETNASIRSIFYFLHKMQGHQSHRFFVPPLFRSGTGLPLTTSARPKWQSSARSSMGSSQAWKRTSCTRCASLAPAAVGTVKRHLPLSSPWVGIAHYPLGIEFS